MSFAIFARGSIPVDPVTDHRYSDAGRVALYRAIHEDRRDMCYFLPEVEPASLACAIHV